MKKNKKGFTLIELLAVILILGIVLGIAIGSYHKYLINSRNKSYNIAEVSFKSAAVEAVSECFTENGEKRSFCKDHEWPENQYDYELVYLSELTKEDYINPIKNPYDTETLCNEKSYVYIKNKADMETEKNADFDYKVCLICGNHKSKDCLENIDINSEYNAYCKISYDPEGMNLYDGKWTDQDLYITLTVDGKYKYGISYFLYKIGTGKEIRVGATEDKALIPLKNTIDNKEITITAKDGLGNSATTTCGANVKIDKTKIINAKLEGRLLYKKTTILSDEWASEDVLLTVTPNPKKIPSGYYYQWYKDGVKIGEETQDNTHVVTENGTYQVVVTNGLRNQTVTTNEFIVKFDRTPPTITVISNPKILGTQDYTFTNNVTSTFGISGGRTVCSPAVSKKTGIYNVTCSAIGNNKLVASAIFQVKHNYPATIIKNGCSKSMTYTCRNPHDCHSFESDYREGTTCTYDCTGTCNGTEHKTTRQEAKSRRDKDSDGNWGEWNGYGDGPFTITGSCHYDCYIASKSCPQGGTLSGSTCYY